jgi:hypothetical protein
VLKYALYHKDIWGSGGVAPSFFTSALDGVEWPVSRLDRFTPGERAPSTHWIEDWLGPRTDLNDMEKRKTYPCRGSNLGRIDLL